jgi:hypothetical protein
VRWVRGAKDRRTIFLASMGPVLIPQNCVRTPYVEFVFLHPVVSAGHIVILVPPGHETSTHYFSFSGGMVQFL